MEMRERTFWCVVGHYVFFFLRYVLECAGEVDNYGAFKVCAIFLPSM